MQSNPSSGDRGCPGPSIGLNDVTIDTYLTFTERLKIDNSSQGSADQSLNFLGPSGLFASRRFPPHTLCGRSRKHAIFRRHPATVCATQPGWYPIFQTGRAQDMRVAEFYQT